MAGAILDVGNLILVRFAIGSGAEFIKDSAQGVNNVEVGLLVPAADVVDLAHPTRFKDAADGAAVVFHIEPVAYLLAVTIDGQRLASQGIVDTERDELFREVVRAVVVGAVGGEHWQTVGVVVGAHEMVAGGLARRVRAVGFVAVGLGEGGIMRGEGAVDFVGGDVEEAELFLGRFFELTVVRAHGFEQVEGADDVGLDEVFRTMDTAVDVRFGGEIDDGAGLVVGEEIHHEIEVADVAVDEHVTGVAIQRGEVLEIARVGKRVEVDDRLVRLRQPVEDEVAADEASTAGDKNHLFGSNIEGRILL